MSKRVIVHAGFHKTGTTSIQLFLQRHRDRLRRAGIEFYAGRYIDNNHVELHAAAMRDDRMSTWKLASGFRSSAMFPAIAEHIERAIESSPCDTVLFSAEGISYLRFDDEMARLHELVGNRPSTIIVYQRERSAWIESFKSQIAMNNSFSVDKDAFNYVEPDSWLFDFNARTDAFRRTFGLNTWVFDYDNAVQRDGSIIPSFLDIIGARAHFSAADWLDLWENKRSSAQEAHRRD